MSEDIRETALRLAKEAGWHHNYVVWVVRNEEIEHLVRLAFKEAMERAAKVIEQSKPPAFCEEDWFLAQATDIRAIRAEAERL